MNMRENTFNKSEIHFFYNILIFEPKLGGDSLGFVIDEYITKFSILFPSELLQLVVYYFFQQKQLKIVKKY